MNLVIIRSQVFLVNRNSRCFINEMILCESPTFLEIKLVCQPRRATDFLLLRLGGLSSFISSLIEKISMKTYSHEYM